MGVVRGCGYVVQEDEGPEFIADEEIEQSDISDVEVIQASDIVCSLLCAIIIGGGKGGGE